MPVCLEKDPSRSLSTPPVFDSAEASSVTIGLVNNMPDAALQATERQFVALLGGAADGIAVRLRMYALPDVPRTAWGREYVNRFYTPIDELWDSHVDALIVTGTEPRTPDLKEEPYWPAFTKLVEWAETHTYSTVWSCLATHAAVLHLDGIDRRPLNEKRFGIYECDRVSDHPLMAGAPSRVQMPHSRWNELPEDALRSSGYSVLTRSDAAGADAFVRERKSLFVFFQGHPEYEAQTLLLEYRRDIKRFLMRERDTYPTMPCGYFDEATVEALSAMQTRAATERREETLTDFPTALAAGSVTNTWRSTATQVYRNWLRSMSERKQHSAHVRS